MFKDLFEAEIKELLDSNINQIQISLDQFKKISHQPWNKRLIVDRNPTQIDKLKQLAFSKKLQLEVTDKSISVSTIVKFENNLTEFIKDMDE